MGKSKIILVMIMCLAMSACVFSGKKITVVDKSLGIAVSISEDELSVVGEIPISDTVSIVVTEGE